MLNQLNSKQFLDTTTQKGIMEGQIVQCSYTELTEKKDGNIYSKQSQWNHQQEGLYIVAYVPTNQNPSDVGSRGLFVDNLQQLWVHGPK